MGATDRTYNVMGRRISRRLIPYLLAVFFAFALLLYWVSNLGRPSWEEQKVAAKEEEKAHQAAQTQPGTKTEIQSYISEAEKDIANKKAKEKEAAEKARREAEKKRADELESTKKMLAVGGFAPSGMPDGTPPAMDGRAIDPVEMKRLADARNASMHATAEAALYEDYGNSGFMNASGNGAVPDAVSGSNQQVAKMQEQQRKRDEDRRAEQARLVNSMQAQNQKQPVSSAEGWQNERAEKALKPSPALLPEPAPSRFLLRQGFAIPVVLEREINSELPGQIRARVISDVYDSLRNRYLLIPKMSILIGEYKSEMGVGEERLMIVFTRILLPDGRSVRLPAMSGSDSMGRMGKDGDVNTRFWRVFGPSFLIAMITKMAEPQTPQGSTVNVYGTGQTWPGVAAQSLADSSKKIIERYSTAGTYIVIPAGEQINVIVTQDIAIPPGAAFASVINNGGQM